MKTGTYIEVQPGILVEKDERVGDWCMTATGWQYVGLAAVAPPIPLELAWRRPPPPAQRRRGHSQAIFTGATTR